MMPKLIACGFCFAKISPKSESDEDQNPVLFVDYDSDGHIVGLEILDASKQVNLPEDLATAGVEAL